MKDKENWKRFVKEYKNELIFSIKGVNGKFIYPQMKYTNTLYESEKGQSIGNLYFNIEHNWFKFDTIYRTKSGKGVYIYIASKERMVRILYTFCRFQNLIGVELKEELVFHCLNFISDKMILPDGIFECNEENKQLLYKIAERILTTKCPEDIYTSLLDKRNYCIDSCRCCKDKSELNKVLKKGQRLYNNFMILKRYDENKSIRKNAEDLGVSKKSIERFIKIKDEVQKLYENLQ